MATASNVQRQPSIRRTITWDIVTLVMPIGISVVLGTMYPAWGSSLSVWSRSWRGLAFGVMSTLSLIKILHTGVTYGLPLYIAYRWAQQHPRPTRN